MIRAYPLAASIGGVTFWVVAAVLAVVIVAGVEIAIWVGVVRFGRRRR